MCLFYYRLPRIAQNTATTTIVHIVQIQIVHSRVSSSARMGQIMGIHGLLLRWLLAPEFLSQGCSKILHSILFRIWFIFLFSRLEAVKSGDSGLWSQYMEYLDLRQVLSSHKIDSTSVDTDSVCVRIFEGIFSGQRSTYLKITISSIYILLKSCYDL